MPFLGYRDVPRRRRRLPPGLLWLVRPLFRYSDWRNAWILRVVGERYGPVFQVPPRRELRRSRGRFALIAGGVILVAAVLGFLSARAADGGSSVPRHKGSVAGLHSTGSLSRSVSGRVSAGSLEVTFPSGWQSRPAQDSAGLGLADGVAAVSAGRLIAVGRATTTDPSLLPASILDGAQAPPRAQLVTLGPTTFYQYVNVSLSGDSGSNTVYAVPTASGTVLAVCRAGAPSAAFATTCQQVVESIRLGSASLGPGLLPSYASALSAVIDHLDAVRATAGSRLSTGRTVRIRARAARRLALANGRAARAVAALSAGPASSANTALAVALNAEARAYAALWQAVAHSRIDAYRTAAAALAQADTALSLALVRLQAGGYRVG